MLNSENKLGEDGDKKSDTELRESGGSSPVVNYGRSCSLPLGVGVCPDLA